MGTTPSIKAIELMRRRYGIDLSFHRSRDVDAVQFHELDYIVAMKPEYKDRLVREFKVPPERIVEWNVEDPWIEGTDRAYEACLHEVEQLLGVFVTLLNSRSQ